MYRERQKQGHSSECVGQFVLALLFITYCIFHMNSCKPTFAPPCILSKYLYIYIYIYIYKRVSITTFIYLFNFFKDFIYLFLDRGEGRERNINVWLPLEHPLLGTWPATLACALTGNQTGDPLVCGPALNLLSHTSQGYLFNFLFIAFREREEGRERDRKHRCCCSTYLWTHWWILYVPW